MDPVKLLEKQHREVEALFKKVGTAEGPSERRRLMDEIRAEEMVLEAYEEHHVVKLVLAELPKVDPEDERFEAKMTVLSELVEHHADEEESEMFKLAQRLGDDELEALGEQMQAQMGEQGRARRAA